MPHSTSASMTRFLDQQTRTNYPTTVIKSDKIWTRSTRRTIEVKEQSGRDADVRNRHPLHSFPTWRLLYRNAARRWWHTIYRPQLEASVGRALLHHSTIIGVCWRCIWGESRNYCNVVVANIHQPRRQTAMDGRPNRGSILLIRVFFGIWRHTYVGNRCDAALVS